MINAVSKENAGSSTVCRQSYQGQNEQIGEGQAQFEDPWEEWPGDADAGNNHDHDDRDKEHVVDLDVDASPKQKQKKSIYLPQSTNHERYKKRITNSDKHT